MVSPNGELYGYAVPSLEAGHDSELSEPAEATKSIEVPDTAVLDSTTPLGPPIAVP
jgi:hypothetical protein